MEFLLSHLISGNDSTGSHDPWLFSVVLAYVSFPRVLALAYVASPSSKQHSHMLYNTNFQGDYSYA